MHFYSFMINLLAWTFTGIALGFFLHKGIRIKQNGSIFVGSIFSLGGGIFASMTHGMYPEIGIDLFNITVSFLFSLVGLYIFAPNTRQSMAAAGWEAFDKTKNLLQEGGVQKSPYFTSAFWKNIISLLNP